MRITFRLLAISSLGLILSGAAAARTRPHYGGTLRMETSNAVANDSPATALVSETLTTVDALGRAQPLLADRWESQNSAKRWQFWIRPNVRFHDGKVLTASDVAQALNNKQGAPWRTVRASGSAVIFESDDPQPLLPAVLALAQFTIAKTDGAGLLIGTGPYRLTVTAGNISKLVAFDDYWQGRVYVDAIEVAGNRGLRDQWMDMSVGRADMVEVPAEQIRHAQQERLHTLISRNMELVALVTAQNSQTLQDVRMRQAISAAIDRTSLLNFIFQKQGEISAAILPNWLTGYDFLFAAPQNQTLARELRGQAKVTGPITIGYEAGDGTQQLLADRVVLNARDAGISMQSVPRNGKVQADLDLVRMMLASPNPGIALHQLTASSLPGDAEPVEAGLDGIYNDERELISSARIIPLLYVPRAFAGSQRLRNWTLDAVGVPATTQIWLEDRR